ncbi:Fe2+-dependent dioxygenase [Undibacterium fentianense]|uniref:Fe2+-dependent dioxygenase n=1 Tax=Undibacterium fentianense TaxID=2828728 RepID=A0A941E2M6_9BURK|nr:Fe2+-dependent dioxygenase [Undibacterium fentianense]MBR7799871.1 Fe2+-dependent dioxygenase [Undibacterium fentianense]
MMLHIPEVLSKEEVKALRQKLDASNWVDGKETVGEQGARVKKNRQLAEHSPLSIKLGQIVANAVRRHPLFFAAALPLRIAPPLFNAYAGGEHYGLHVDGSIREVLNADYQLRTDLSSTLFLSEPDEYEGGELEVVDTYGTHQVKLPAGDLILYPSSSLHQVKPVTAGTRVCSFFWTQSMIRQDAQRTMLFEMDQHIQSLRLQLGDTPAVLGLTGQYHNLLRMWAET